MFRKKKIDPILKKLKEKLESEDPRNWEVRDDGISMWGSQRTYSIDIQKLYRVELSRRRELSKDTYYNYYDLSVYEGDEIYPVVNFTREDAKNLYNRIDREVRKYKKSEAEIEQEQKKAREREKERTRLESLVRLKETLE